MVGKAKTTDFSDTPYQAFYERSPLAETRRAFRRVTREFCRFCGGREVPMNEILKTALRQAMPVKGEPDDLVLGGVDWVKDNWPLVCKEARMEDLHFHGLRATYVTRILEAGFDSFTARDAAGHTNVKTMGIYARPSIERVRKAVDSLSGTAQIRSGSAERRQG